MSEQCEYYTFTKDVKTLIQYVQYYAINHQVVETANRLNRAIKKGLRDYGIPVTPIKESKDSFEEEKLQYAEDLKTHERPWELWQTAIKTQEELAWDDCTQPLPWHKYCAYRRKQTTFVPKYYSGLNWRDAEHLIGKTVKYTNHPDIKWYFGTLKDVLRDDVIAHFDIISDVEVDFFVYIKTCEETFKPPTINIGGVELPMPETFALEFRTKYWLSPTCTEMCWNCAPSDIDALQAGQVHLTEERAKAWTDWWKKEVLAKIKEIAS